MILGDWVGSGPLASRDSKEGVEPEDFTRSCFLMPYSNPFSFRDHIFLAAHSSKNHLWHHGSNDSRARVTRYSLL